MFQRGRFVRLRSPFEATETDRLDGRRRRTARTAIVGYYQVLNRPVPTADHLRLRGLDPARAYRVTRLAGRRAIRSFRANPGERRGDELMRVGLSLGAERHEAARWGDFRAWLFVLERV